MDEQVERKRLLSTPRFSVEKRVFRAASGDAFERFAVVHPGAVVIVPVLDDERIVLIRQIRHIIDREIWELPAGTRDVDGEDPTETARRELEEETGYQAREIEPLASYYTSPGILTERMHAFVARGLDAVGQRLEGGERIKVVPTPMADVRHMVRAGDIQDAKSIAALALYLFRKKCGEA